MPDGREPPRDESPTSGVLGAAAPLDDLITKAVLQSFVEEAHATGPGWTEPTDDMLAARYHQLADAAVPRIVEYTVDDVLTQAHQPDRLPKERSARAAFRDTVRASWGDAIDSFEVLLVVFEEIGHKHLTRALEAARLESSNTSRALAALKCHVLTGLHARACRTAREILCLLEDGLADGALARGRTLHEVAVVAIVLAMGDATLAMRYDLHGVVQAVKSMEQFHKHHGALGWAPVDAGELKAGAVQAEALLEHFGKPFEHEFGWADGVVPRRPGAPKGKLGLADLEHAVGLAHFRPFFGWSSDSVHGGSQGLHSLGHGLDAPRVPYTRGSDSGLVDPGQHAALSLRQFALGLAQHLPTPPVLDTAVRARIVAEVASGCQARFVKAHEAVSAKAPMSDPSPGTPESQA